MSEIQHLEGRETIKKIQSLGEHFSACMFCTYVNGKLISRPMSVNKYENSGVIWFLSDKTSNKNQQIRSDDRVELIFAEGSSRFMSLSGHASIESSRERIKELWTPIAKIWFTEGVDDPRISCIRFTFEDGYYWDTKHGKGIEIIKMAASLITGKTMDDGIEGELD